MNTKTPLLHPLLLACGIGFSLAAGAQPAPVQVKGNPFNPNTVLPGLGQDYRADDIPSGEAGYYYIPGAAAGADSVTTAYYGKTFKFGAGFRLGLNRQCGEINPFKNMKAQLEKNVKEKVREFKELLQALPQLIAGQALEYALAKINPELYQLTQVNLDEYFELFQINVKSCEQVRSELLRDGDKAPGMDKLLQIAVGDEWKRMIDTGEFVNSRHIQKEVIENAAKKGVVMADGKAYGGENQEPINFTQSLVKAGYSIITGHKDGKTGWDSPLAGKTEDYPIAKHFKSSKDMAAFLEDIYGSTTRRLNASGKSGVESSAGTSIGPAYNELRNKYLTQLKEYAERKIDRKKFEQETGILIAPAVMEDIRRAEPYQRAALIEDRAKQDAIDTMVTRLYLASDVLRAGINAPDMVQSDVYSIAREEYEKLYFSIQDDIARLQNSRYR
jgi:lipoprotein